MVSPVSKISYAGSLFCHIKFMFFPHHQGYYQLFFLLLKKITYKWAKIFPATSPPSGILTHLPYCPPAQHTSKHQQLLCPPPPVPMGSTLPPHQRELVIARLRHMLVTTTLKKKITHKFTSIHKEVKQSTIITPCLSH